MQPSQLQELLQRITSLRAIMVSVATGGPKIQEKDDEYRNLYSAIADEIETLRQGGLSIRNSNPYKSLWDWYGYWSTNLSSYQSRRQYIAELYQELTDPIESALRTNKVQHTSIETLTRDLSLRFSQSLAENASPHLPVEIQDSLVKFQRDYPDLTKTAFIIMKFSKNQVHQDITSTIKGVLAPKGITGVRADDKQYHDDLFYNILTYIYGCQFGIAVFDRIEADDFNPNVALEVGYMLALNKSVCLLKDQTLKSLHADLVGKLYKPFDAHNISGTLPNELSKWMSDKDLG